MTTALALALLASPQPLTLRHAFTVGEERRYLLTMQFENCELEERTTQREDLIWKVESVDQAGVAKLSLRRRLVGLVLDGQDVPLTASQEWLTLTERRNPRGFVRDREPHPQEPTAHERLHRLFDWTYPVTPIRVGATWRAGFGPDEELRVAGLDWAFRLESANETEARVRASFREETPDGIQGTGFATIDRLSGWPLKVTLQVRGILVPGDEMRVPMVGTFELVYQPQKPTNADPGS